jgi:hypothetical protein
VGIVGGLAGPGEVDPHAVLISPRVHRLTEKFTAVVPSPLLETLCRRVTAGQELP